MSGFFNELDIASAADDPFRLEPGIYETVITEVKVVTIENGERKGRQSLVVTFSATEGDHKGKSVDRYLTIPDKKFESEEKFNKNLSWLKSFLKRLEIPESRMNSVGPDDLLGLEVVVTLKQKGDYVNIVKEQLKRSGMSRSEDGDDPFADTRTPSATTADFDDFDL